MKRVRITIEMSSSFVKLLHANLTLHGDANPDNDDARQTDVRGVLARLVCLEARGATEAQIHYATPHAWRPDVEIVHEERRVIEPAKSTEVKA